MEQERIVEMMKRIDDYIHGKLNYQEEEALWVEFLKNPHWFSMFEIELSLRHLAKHSVKND